LTKWLIIFHYSCNLQHPAPILRVQPLNIGVSLVAWLAGWLVGWLSGSSFTSCYIGSDEKGIDTVAGKTGQDIK
jgi:hypothetical protein